MSSLLSSKIQNQYSFKKRPLLIYKTDKDLFHGFKEIPKNSFRYAITAQFNQEE